MSSTTTINTGVNTAATHDTLALIGRLLIAYLFVPAGWGKIAGFAGTAGYIASKGLPLPELAAALSIAVELGLGLLVLVGWRTRWAALGLAIFVAVITPMFHAYWSVPEAQQMMQKISFDKNVAIVGGLLLLVGFGAGRWSIDGKRGPA
ncbi:MAG TPA: DoxX family protein [Ramlibacter sp.]|nr:DoxX family protein [Ramlibacter sp.]